MTTQNRSEHGGILFVLFTLIGSVGGGIGSMYVFTQSAQTEPVSTLVMGTVGGIVVGIELFFWFQGGESFVLGLFRYNGESY
jgi:hypothetical protein